MLTNMEIENARTLADLTAYTAKVSALRDLVARCDSDMLFLRAEAADLGVRGPIPDPPALTRLRAQLAEATAAEADVLRRIAELRGKLGWAVH